MARRSGAAAGEVSHAGLVGLHPDQEDALADVEVGHRSVSVCHRANITRHLAEKLKWDPGDERFISDGEANSLVSRPRRKGYELPAGLAMES